LLFDAYPGRKGNPQVGHQIGRSATLSPVKDCPHTWDSRDKYLIIAFDTFFLTKQFRNVGIYEYSKNLLREFRKIAEQDDSIRIRYFASSGYSDDIVFEKSVSGCEAVNTRLLRFHRLWRLGLIAASARWARADLIFTPSPNTLPLGVLPVAVTIHDAMPERLPAEMVAGRKGLRMNIWLAAKFSQKILTDSEHSKKDLVELYNLPPEKVSVIYLGYDRDIFNTSPVDSNRRASLWARHGIHGRYILHHGMVHLRKNLGRLIHAYDLLLDRHPSLGLQLVLAGPFGQGSEQIHKIANERATNNRVIFTGPLDDEDLAVLVKGASLCVIPSLYEGFCLPMVEAMACGVPTVAANGSCIPEVSGGVLRYFDPLSEEEMAATMEDVLEHPALQEELIAKGLKRASEFSWRRCAVETLKALLGPNEN
jgi:glycosyltransferase involved in cell wall biosynthesis